MQEKKKKKAKKNTHTFTWRGREKEEWKCFWYEKGACGKKIYESNTNLAWENMNQTIQDVYLWALGRFTEAQTPQKASASSVRKNIQHIHCIYSDAIIAIQCKHHKRREPNRRCEQKWKNLVKAPEYRAYTNPSPWENSIAFGYFFTLFARKFVAFHATICFILMISIVREWNVLPVNLTLALASVHTHTHTNTDA